MVEKVHCDNVAVAVHVGPPRYIRPLLLGARYVWAGPLGTGVPSWRHAARAAASVKPAVHTPPHETEVDGRACSSPMLLVRNSQVVTDWAALVAARAAMYRARKRIHVRILLVYTLRKDRFLQTSVCAARIGSRSVELTKLTQSRAPNLTAQRYEVDGLKVQLKKLRCTKRMDGVGCT
jgi:hypothetical protein